MPILRRSLNNNSSSSSATSPSHSQSPPLPLPLARPSEKVAPPQKVIKALRTHKSTNPQELSYQQGDFWYVTGEREGWFEALSECRTVSSTRCPNVTGWECGGVAGEMVIGGCSVEMRDTARSGMAALGSSPNGP